MSGLVFDRVSKVYGEKGEAVTALDSVSFSLQAGEFVAIVGPSGSGKTTLLATAGALLQPSSGVITLNDKKTSGLTPSQLAALRLHHIGFILQSSNLVPYLTAMDQLLLLSKMAGRHGAESRARAKELLTKVGLGHRLRHYPEAMSGGEKQRVAIARALLNDPDFILADEPTASLDSHRGREVVELLANEVHNRNKAAIMVTHDERLLDLCDRVIRMVDGKLTESASV